MSTRLRFLGYGIAAIVFSLSAALGGMPPTPYVHAMPTYQRRPCPALTVNVNMIAPAAVTPGRYFCGLTPKVSLNPKGGFWIEAHGAFWIVKGSKQFISYSWNLTKKDRFGKFGTPVAHSNGSCGSATTYCTWGTYPYRDKGDGQYQFELLVKFSGQPNVRYVRIVRFYVPGAAWPWN